jgi:hypothetical protein
LKTRFSGAADQAAVVKLGWLPTTGTITDFCNGQPADESAEGFE